MSDPRVPLAALTHEGLVGLVVGLGAAPSHADRVASHLLRRGAPDLASVPNLGPRLLARLSEALAPRVTRVVERADAPDGTSKLLVELDDGARVESVLMPLSRRYSGCVSSQVGCGAACRFCASGLAGLRRSLRSHEIVEQALHLGDLSRARGRRLDNLVFMGVGEPLHAYDSVVGAIRWLTDPRLLGMGPSRLTVSTVGIVPGILALAEEGLGVHLAVSLHAAQDDLRASLLPVGGRWSVAEVLDAAERFRVRTRRFVTIQVTLLAGVNDGPEHARALVEALDGRPFHVNLIPANPVPGLSHVPPAQAVLEAFRDALLRAGVVTHVRASRGREAQAACGQLAGARGAPA